MKHSVAVQNAIPQDYHFSELLLAFIHKCVLCFLWKIQTNYVFAALVFRPISAKAKLRMNPRSDVDFSSPKVDLVVNLAEVAVELSRPQVWKMSV